MSQYIHLLYIIILSLLTATSKLFPVDYHRAPHVLHVTIIICIALCYRKHMLLNTFIMFYVLGLFVHRHSVCSAIP